LLTYGSVLTRLTGIAERGLRNAGMAGSCHGSTAVAVSDAVS